jgi:hypothetical protein
MATAKNVAKKNAAAKNVKTAGKTRRVKAVVTFTRGGTVQNKAGESVTRKDILFRHFLSLPVDERKTAALVAFATQHGFGLSEATIGKWCSRWNNGGRGPVRSRHLIPAKKTKKTSAKKTSGKRAAKKA